MSTFPIALTIAGSDPSGGAGIQCDLKVFQELSVYGLSVITCITSQVPGIMKSVHPLQSSQVVSQIETLKSNYSISAIKIGLLHNKTITEAVINVLDSFENRPPIIIDPIIKSSSGTLILEDGALELYKEYLIPMADVYTPNIPEGNILVGNEISSQINLAKSLYSKFGTPVLLKGGHLNSEVASDIFVNADGLTTYDSPMIKNFEAHGTGCFYSASICSHIALGYEIKKAISKSKRHVTEAIKCASNLGGNSKTLSFKTL